MKYLKWLNNILRYIMLVITVDLIGINWLGYPSGIIDSEAFCELPIYPAWFITFGVAFLVSLFYTILIEVIVDIIKSTNESNDSE